MAGRPEEPRVRPEGSQPSPGAPARRVRRGWRGRSMVVATAATLAVGLLVGFGLGRSAPPPTTLGTVTPPPSGGSASTSSSARSGLPSVVLGVQTSSRLWEFDRHGSELRQWVGVEDSAVAPAKGVLAGRRPGEVFYGSSDGSETMLALDDQLFPDGVAPNPMMAASVPDVVVPLRSGRGAAGEVVLALRSFGGSGASDIDVPGCGIPYPFVTRGVASAFGLWCTARGELGIYRGRPAGLAVRVAGLAPGESPAIATSSGRAVIVAADGSFWMAEFDGPSVAEGSLASLGGGKAALIASISPDGETLYVGVATADDLASGRRQASRLVVYRLPGGPQTVFDLPAPAESIAATAGGTVYGYYPGAVGDGFHAGSELFAIDPETGSSAVVAKPLTLGDGRLFVVAS